MPSALARIQNSRMNNVLSLLGELIGNCSARDLADFVRSNCISRIYLALPIFHHASNRRPGQGIVRHDGFR